jgi:hypothetical protein
VDPTRIPGAPEGPEAEAWRSARERLISVAGFVRTLLAHDLHALSRAVTYGWGMIPLRARIGATEWATSLWPKEGLYIVPVKDAVRRAEGLDVGDTVTVRLTVAGPR